MIRIDLIQKTAETLMDKAAIEIPQDYLSGLEHAAKTEDGNLSSFVLRAMLENYEAAKEDRRAMCGDTGVPRWFVKMGNGASAEGGMI
ncbi:MAG: fumarate hydratase, partial [Paracoccaceae bacterium]|nr:fumarate hydratase [Paracoccaceae bacterium]